MSSIVVVDTSVLLNILNVPDRNQQFVDVVDRLGTLIDAGDHLFTPMAAIVEAGNLIAHGTNGAQRRAAAEGFVKQVRGALCDEAPWKPINFPSNAEVLRWLAEFPDSATQGIGIGDLSIKHEWKVLCAKHPLSHVWVWTLDNDLAGLDRPAPMAPAG